MSISQIETIVQQGAKAFADGNKLDSNPYVNNPEFQMHWQTGFQQAAMAAVATAAPVVEAKQEQAEDTTETPAEEAPAVEAKPAKASKTKE